jgi:hypothetical protein
MRMQHLKRRHKKMHRSPILKNKRSLKKSAKESKKRAVSQPGGAPDIGVRCAPDYPVRHRTVCAERPKTGALWL